MYTQGEGGRAPFPLKSPQNHTKTPRNHPKSVNFVKIRPQNNSLYGPVYTMFTVENAGTKPEAYLGLFIGLCTSGVSSGGPPAVCRHIAVCRQINGEGSPALLNYGGQNSAK